MSITETAPQTQKEFNPRSQEHGSAPQRRGRDNPSFYEEFLYDEDEPTRKDVLDAALQADFTANTDDLSDELRDAVANRLLGENEPQTSDFIKALPEIYATITDPLVRLEIKDLVDQYHAVLADKTRASTSDLDFQERLTQDSQFQSELDDLEEEVKDILDQYDAFPTVSEIGLKTSDQMKKEMIQGVQQDFELKDDSAFDDFGSHIRINDQLPR